MSVKKEFISGVLFTAIAKYSGIAVQIIITAILSRLLTPDDFGSVAIVTVIINFFNIFSEAGIGPAIIQRKSLTTTDYNSLFTITFIIGIALLLLFVSSSGIIAQYYRDPNLTGLCLALSVVIVITSMNTIPNSLLLKDKRFKLIAARTLSAQLLSGIIAVIAAFMGYGVYALVLSAIVSAACILIINLCSNPLRFQLKFSALKGIMSFSIYQFFANIITYFGRNSDKLIIGRYLGMDELGFYDKSYRLMMLPLSNITFVITPVLHPILSNFQNDINEIAKKYLKLIYWLSILAVPVSVAMFFCAKELVLILFGNQWMASIPAFEILSLTAGLQILNSTSGSIFQSIDKTRDLFIGSLVCIIFMIIGLILAVNAWHTIEAVAWSFDITFAMGALVVFAMLFRDIKVKFKDIMQIMYKPFVILLVLSGIVILYNRFVAIDSLFVSLILKISILLIAFVCSTLLLKIISVQDLMNLKCIINRMRKVK